MDAPFWVATGWGGAQVPLDVLIPVYGGYSDGFWEESDVELPQFSAMHFTFSDVRDDLSVGADVRSAPPTDGLDDRRYPFITCELGGGMAVAYHRRPLVESADVGALALTKLGSGSAWQGYYVYHGTVQATGALTGMQESHDSAYPNELPRKDYDFYAPIGSAGTIRPHYHFLRAQHLFLQQWGPDLLELPVAFPDPAEVGLRTSLRVRDGKGYVFGNNHQPAAAASGDVDDFQFTLSDQQAVPSSPIRVPSGTYFVWPIGQGYGDVVSLTGTVQPVTQIQTPSGLVVVFRATEGIDVELDIDSGGADILGARQVETPRGVRWVPETAPGPDSVVTVGRTRLVILDAAAGVQVWRGHVAGGEVVALWDGGLTFDEDRITLERWTDRDEILTIPALDGAEGRVGPFHRLALPAAPTPESLSVRAVAPAAGAPKARRGGTMNRYSAPLEEEFDSAAVFEIDIALDPQHDGAEVLAIEWSGDVARAYIGDELISDQFWYGRTWEIDVRHLPALASAPLRIQILPWNGEADFFVDRRVRDQRVSGRAEIQSASIVRAAHHTVAPAGVGARGERVDAR